MCRITLRSAIAVAMTLTGRHVTVVKASRASRR